MHIMSSIKSRDAVYVAAAWKSPDLLHLLFRWGWLSFFFIVCIPSVATLTSFAVTNWQAGNARQAEYNRLKTHCQKEQYAKQGFYNHRTCHYYANSQVGLYVH